MLLPDAIRAAQKVLDAGVLEPKEQVAVLCLVRLARRVQRLQKPLRQLERALCPAEELNQETFSFDD